MLLKVCLKNSQFVCILDDPLTLNVCFCSFNTFNVSFCQVQILLHWMLFIFILRNTRVFFFFVFVVCDFWFEFWIFPISHFSVEYLPKPLVTKRPFWLVGRHVLVGRHIFSCFYRIKKEILLKETTAGNTCPRLVCTQLYLLHTLITSIHALQAILYRYSWVPYLTSCRLSPRKGYKFVLCPWTRHDSAFIH